MDWGLIFKIATAQDPDPLEQCTTNDLSVWAPLDRPRGAVLSSPQSARGTSVATWGTTTKGKHKCSLN